MEAEVVAQLQNITPFSVAPEHRVQELLVAVAQPCQQLAIAGLLIRAVPHVAPTLRSAVDDHIPSLGDVTVSADVGSESADVGTEAEVVAP